MILIILIIVVIYLFLFRQNKYSNFVNELEPFGNQETIEGFGNDDATYFEFNKYKNNDVFDDEDMGKHVLNKLVKKPVPKSLWDITFTKSNEIIKPVISNLMSESKDINTMTHDNDTFTLLGTATNVLQGQNFLIYETLTKQKGDNIIVKDNLNYLDNQLYNYLLVVITDNKQVVKFVINPRNKINIGDTVYLAEGPLQLGPLQINKFINK